MRKYHKAKKDEITYKLICRNCGKSFMDENKNGRKCEKCGGHEFLSEGPFIRSARVIAFIEGGVMHDVMADTPVQFRTIDYDVEGSDDYVEIMLPEGTEKQEVHVIKHDLKGIENLDPFFNQKEIA